MGDSRQQALALFDRTAWVITAAADEGKSGLVATFVSSASLVPELPRLSIGLARHHYTWELIDRSRAFAAHLVDEAQVDLMWRFGLDSGRHADKLAGLEWRRGQTASPILAAALAWLECTVEAAFDIGDRTIYLGAVVDGGVNREGTAITQNRLFALATAEQLQRMDTDRHNDEGIDREAILAWRATHSQRGMRELP